MRKTQFALAAVALIASTAAMAEVTVSGYMDVAVQAARPTGGVSTTSLQSGLLAPNTLGFSGSEDMGNGLKATFNLTSRFEAINGGWAAAGTTPFIISQVGVAGEFGSVNMGKTVDAFWGNGVAAFDVTGGGNMGSSVDAVLKLNLSPVFSANSIQYVAPTIGGLNVAATYQLNDSATAKADATYSVAALYAAGPVSAGAGYAETAGVLNANTPTKGYFVGAGYDAGVAKINALYMSSKPTAAGSVDSTVWGLNAGVPVSAAVMLTAGYYDYDMAGTSAKVTSIGAKYALSKRTTLFANYQNATSGTVIGLNTGTTSPASTAAGNAFTVGVGHSF